MSIIYQNGKSGADGKGASIHTIVPIQHITGLVLWDARKAANASGAVHSVPSRKNTREWQKRCQDKAAVTSDFKQPQAAEGA
jgi:hypothetical protein